MSAKARVRAAVVRCQVRNFDDLDLLLKIFSNASTVGTSGISTLETELVQELRDATNALGNMELKDRLERWKEERKLQNG